MAQKLYMLAFRTSKFRVWIGEEEILYNKTDLKEAIKDLILLSDIRPENIRVFEMTPIRVKMKPDKNVLCEDEERTIVLKGGTP